MDHIRMIVDDFQEAYGVAAAVVNKPVGGGGPFPGAVEDANAPADGTTRNTSLTRARKFSGVIPERSRTTRL